MNTLKYIYFIPLLIILNLSLLAEDNYIVKTTSGISHGVIENKGVITWHDLPYAIPPVNELRWKAPREFVNDTKIIKDKIDNFCVQRPSSLGGANSSQDFVGTEDCLYLDIRAPKNSKKSLAVMFWIHGGGNTTGLKDIYDFSGLVKNENVIVVSLNYRLGPFGWFSHPSIQSLKKVLIKLQILEHLILLRL